MKAAIFDLDGTLIDSMRVWDSIGYDYLKDTEAAEGLNNVLRTMSFQDTANYIRKSFDSELSTQILEYIRSQYHERIPLKSGVKNTLEKLKQKGISMCVATAMDHTFAEKCLRRLGVLEYFKFIITCDEVGQGKRKPKIFLEAASRLGFRPDETTVFEDSVHCAKTAKAAGFQVTGVFDEPSKADKDELREVCDQFIDTFEEL